MGLVLTHPVHIYCFRSLSKLSGSTPGKSLQPLLPNGPIQPPVTGRYLIFFFFCICKSWKINVVSKAWNVKRLFARTALGIHFSLDIQEAKEMLGCFFKCLQEPPSSFTTFQWVSLLFWLNLMTSLTEYTCLLLG